jgi:hypothetical protein
MTASIPMSGQAKGKPEAIVAATTQTPKAIIPAEIKNESTISMMEARKIEAEKPVLRTQPGIRSGKRERKGRVSANERKDRPKAVSLK